MPEHASLLTHHYTYYATRTGFSPYSNMKSSCRAWARLELEMGHFEENESEASNARTGQWLQQFIVPSSAQVLLALNNDTCKVQAKSQECLPHSRASGC